MASASTVILGTGAYAPERVLSNDELSKTVDTSDEWIRTRTGIRERRIAAVGEHASDMGVKAAGGVKDLKSAQAMLDAGADRIGASVGVKIVQESRGATVAAGSPAGY